MELNDPRQLVQLIDTMLYDRMLKIAALTLALVALGQTIVNNRTPQNLAPKLLKSSVIVQVLKADGVYVGSGVLISKKGDILTAAHVVKGAIQQRVFEYNRQQHECTVLSRNDLQDLAVLRCSGLSGRSHIRSVSRVNIGGSVIAVGSPGIDILLVTSGIVSAFDSDNGKILVDAPAGSGMSGGPVFNLKGELVGVVQAIMTRPPFIMVSADSEALKSTIRSVRNK